MYRKVSDFIEDWKIEKQLTLKIFSKINDEDLLIKPNENLRSLGKLAWHITQTLTEMPHKANLFKEDFLEALEMPSASKIIELYEKYSEVLEDAVSKNWDDDSLEEIIDMYGQQWKKNKLLSVLINHQIHHRVQMTVIMRLLNIEVPGIYGPSKEEWLKYGMLSQE